MKTRKTWFITGASRGFGLEITKAVLATGDQVVATVRSKASELAAQFDNHPNLLVVTLDVTREEQAKEAAQAVIERFDKIDILLNNAGYGLLSAVEEATAHINITTPIRIKTAKEFAENLSIHPNHLNALLKKHTGQNVSTHIRNRLLEETKVLLVQTEWPLQDISYSVGFAEQPNFNLFFKKNTGLTPAEFRRNYRAS
ncbi:SDR family NAD(P)-dependent oxidoreductase [Dyadobacter jiangsuensis]